MAKIQSIKKLIVEDWPAAERSPIERLARALNPFIDQVVSALSKRLTLADNFKSQRYDLTLAAGVSTIVVAWDQGEKPTSISIGNLTKTNGDPPAAAFSLSSYPSDKKITLRFLGLDTATAYKVTVIAQI